MSANPAPESTHRPLGIERLFNALTLSKLRRRLEADPPSQSNAAGTTLLALPNEVLLSVSVFLPDDLSRAFFSLTNKRLYTLLPSVTSRASLCFPRAFTRASCTASPATFLPLRWQFLSQLERESRYTPSPHFLCSACCMLHPASSFAAGQASLPPEQRTCFPVLPRVLTSREHHPAIIAVEVCSCWRWTSARRWVEVRQYHAITQEMPWSCSRKRQHACDHTCKKRKPCELRPLVHIRMHLHRHWVTHEDLEFADFAWEEADRDEVDNVLHHLACDRAHRRPEVLDPNPYDVYRPRNLSMVMIRGRCLATECGGRNRCGDYSAVQTVYTGPSPGLGVRSRRIRLLE